MTAPLFARVLGVIALVAGTAGFIPFLTPPAPADAPFLDLAQSYGMLATVFPSNAITSLIALLFGFWGVLAGYRWTSSVTYCRVLMWTCLLAFLFGAIPLLNTFFGIAPLYGNDLLLHAALTIVAGFAGYGRASKHAAPSDNFILGA